MKTYFFSKQGLEGYANTTEPKLYPHAFEPMVCKSEVEFLLERVHRVLDRVIKSEAVKEAPMLSYSEAYSNAKEEVIRLEQILAKMKEPI